MSLGDMLWPRRSAEATINPQNLFGSYVNAVHDMERAAPSADDTKLLAQAWKLFDNEAGRRNSIDVRAGALMPAISIATTLVTGIGFTVMKDSGTPTAARLVILATLIVALIYLIRTMLLLFVIHGKVFRNTADPSDLPTPAGAAAISPYDRGLACKIMTYTIDNYRINNVQSDALVVAQQAFRNAIVSIVCGGTLASVIIFLHSRAPSVGLDV